LILSHDDIDHVGDWGYINQKMRIKEKRAPSDKPDFLSCIRGQH